MCRRDEAMRDQRDCEADLANAREELRQVACLLRGYNCELGGPVLPDDLSARQLCDHLAQAINGVAIERRNLHANAAEFERWLQHFVFQLGGPMSGPADPAYWMVQADKAARSLLTEHNDRGRLLSEGPTPGPVRPDREAVSPLTMALLLRLERMRVASVALIGTTERYVAHVHPRTCAEELRREVATTVDMLAAISRLRPADSTGARDA